MKIMSIQTVINGLLLNAVFILAGCDQLKVTPVNIDGEPIVGHWYIEKRDQLEDEQFYQRLYMHIKADGYVLYANLLCRFNGEAKLQSESRLNLNYMAIKRINTKKIVLQSYPLTPKFELKLGSWPDQNGGILEVDNLPLSSIAADQAPDFEQWQCQ